MLRCIYFAVIPFLFAKIEKTLCFLLAGGPSDSAILKFAERCFGNVRQAPGVFYFRFFSYDTVFSSQVQQYNPLSTQFYFMHGC
jgi:hypothetical protein